MSRSCIECVHNNPNDPSDLAYACLNCSWPTFAGEPTNFKPKPQTNADHIRGMTDEELAEWVWSAECAGRAYGPRGKQAWLDWLKQEASDG